MKGLGSIAGTTFPRRPGSFPSPEPTLNIGFPSRNSIVSPVLYERAHTITTNLYRPSRNLLVSVQSQSVPENSRIFALCCMPLHKSFCFVFCTKEKIYESTHEGIIVFTSVY